MELTAAERALVEVGNALRDGGYRFTTATPATHEIVNRRAAAATARTLRDFFGWSRPAALALLPERMLGCLVEADAVELRDDLAIPRVRYSTLADGLYVHSAFPTTDTDAVFFGPDTYRFCAHLARTVERADRVVDIGAGAGPGGLSLASRVGQIVLADVNDRALSLARVNAALAGAADRTAVVKADVLAGVEGAFDLAIANPPYLVDDSQRAYRDGGANRGTALAVRIVDEALARLSPGGQLIVYTGAPIVDGRDAFLESALPVLAARGARWRYEELDPDVFGEELARAAYDDVERIAAVALSASL